MVLKAKNGCWKKGERCQTHKHPSSFISSGEDGVGESPRSKKIHRQEGDTASFPLSHCFFHSLTLSLWYLTKCCLWEFVWADGPDPSARQVSLSLRECRCVFGWRCWVLSLCVLECGNWAPVLLGLSPDGNCFGEGEEKVEKRKDRTQNSSLLKSMAFFFKHRV